MEAAALTHRHPARSRLTVLRRGQQVLAAALACLPLAGVAWAERCEVAAARGNSLDVVCALSVNEAAQTYRFKADFSGSHDDTSVRISPTLDGVPVQCGEGSRTVSNFETGDVTLACRFRVEPKVGAQQVLGVTIFWSHADPAGYALDLE